MAPWPWVMRWSGTARNEKFDDLGALMNRLVEKMIDCQEELQISLPTIAVVGAQSVGKSSVLENLAGRKFFPRGAGMVTKCALVLQMKRIEPGQEAYMELSHPFEGLKKFTKDSEVRQVIKELTNHLTGGKNVVVKESIILKLFSPDVLDLTLIDLPGLIKNRTHDQPVDIERQVEQLVRSHTESENTIILAVSNADYDIAGSASLQLAMELDPEGLRTVGVVTRIDRAVTPSELVVVRRVLENEAIPKKLGFVGVMNGGDDDGNATFDEIRKREEDFLKQHYRNLAPKHGSRVLQEKLARLLERHIQDKVPLVKDKLEKRRKEIVEELKSYGISLSDVRGPDMHKVSKAFGHCMHQYAEELSAILGFGSKIEASDEAFGPRFRDLLDGITTEIQKAERPSLDKVKKTIRAVTGVQSTLVFPQQAFNSMVNDMAAKDFKAPALEGLQKMVALMEEFVRKKLQLLASSYPNLEMEVSNLMLAELEENSDMCQEYLQQFFLIEGSSPNFNHPQYMNWAARKQKNGPRPCRGGKADDEESLRVDTEKKLENDANEFLQELMTYLEIMEVTIADQVQKVLTAFILKKTVKYAQQELQGDVQMDSDLAHLMELSSEHKERIDFLQRQLDAVLNALDEFKKVHL